MTDVKKYSWHFPFLFASLAVFSFLPFVPALKAGFVWDDSFLITQNPLIHPLTWENIRKIFCEQQKGSFVPLVLLSFAVERHFFGLNSFPYHLDNLILYSLNTFLVYFFLKQLGRSSKIAWVGAALFAVHPIHVESVAWISERKDLLSGLFFWLSIICYVKHLRTTEKRLYFFSFLFFAAAVLSKPAVVVLPVILFAYEVIYEKPSARTMLRLAPYLLLAAGIGGLTLHAFHQDQIIRLWRNDWKLVTYCPLFYLQKVFLPVHLSALYSFPQRTGNFIYESSLFLFLAALALFVYFGRNKKYIYFGGLFFLISLLPVLQWVPVGNTFAADRYLFLAVFGPIFALTGSLVIDKKRTVRPASQFSLLLVVAAAVFACMFLSWKRSEVWQGEVRLWTEALKMEPKNPITRYFRGCAYQGEGRLEDALADYNAAILQSPSYTQVYNNRAVVFGMMGKTDQALEDLDRAIRMEPDSFEYYLNRGVVYAKLGDFEKASRDFQRVLALKPDHVLAKVFLDRALSRERDAKQGTRP